MKIAILILAVFISLPSIAGVLIRDFRIIPPGNDYSQSPLLPKSGDCYMKAADIRSGDIDSLIFFHVIERGTLAGMEQSINVKGKDIEVYLSTCGRPEGYEADVSKKPDGSKTLTVKCSGNAFEGQGSGEMTLSIDKNNVIRSYSLKKRAGWWENFRSIRMSCQF